MKSRLGILPLFLILPFLLQSQTELPLRNASFELGKPGYSTLPNQWIDCGFANESPIDIHSQDTDYFRVESTAAAGYHFIGLVARDNYSWEGIGQQLEYPLQAGKWHTLSFSAKQSKFYISLSRQYSRETNYDGALVLFLWASDTACVQQELLGISPVLDYEDWTAVQLSFVPSQDFEYIWFEVCYEDPEGTPYNGHVLLDDFSPITVWTDTVRYQAVCLGNEFYGWLDRDSLIEEELLAFSMDFARKGFEQGVISAIDQPELHRLWMTEFLRMEAEKTGLRQFILSISPYHLIEFRRALETVGATEALALLQRGFELRALAEQESISEAQLQEFDQLDQQWKETAHLQSYQLEYLTTHQELILQQLTVCQ
jgi:hypothetical protein